jgi:hypothetical protein
VSDASGGEVRLASTLEDYFNGSTVDTTRWLTGTTYNWYVVPPSVSGGELTLDSAYLRSQMNFQAYQPRFFEVRARQRINSSAAGWPDLGFYRELPPFGYGSTYPADSALRIFVSRDTNTTFARGRDGNEAQPLTDIELPVLDLAQYHIFRIEWDAAGTRFYVDGVLQATIPGVATLNTWAFIYHQTPTSYGSSPMQVDWARVGQYPAAGSFESCVQDAGQLVTWSTATWDASTPSGTGLTVSTRTSVDGMTWSGWSVLSGSNITSPAGRYLQYRLNLTTTQVLQSPEVRSITVAAEPYVVPATPAPTNTPTPAPT